MASELYKYDMTGPEIIELKKLLNRHNPTRLPRLEEANNWFGPITMSRVLEFQFIKGLSKDGIAGKNTLKSLRKKSKAKPQAPSGKCIVVNLIDNELFAYESGSKTHTIKPIRGGSFDHPTRRGVFKMSSRRLKNHTSSLYPEPPGNMDFSLFFDGAIAIHQGPPTEESHGCVHVGPPYAERLFSWAGQSNILVIVAKLTK